MKGKNRNSNLSLSEMNEEDVYNYCRVAYFFEDSDISFDFSNIYYLQIFVCMS